MALDDPVGKHGVSQTHLVLYFTYCVAGFFMKGLKIKITKGSFYSASSYFPTLLDVKIVSHYLTIGKAIKT